MDKFSNFLFVVSIEHSREKTKTKTIEKSGAHVLPYLKFKSSRKFSPSVQLTEDLQKASTFLEELALQEAETHD